MAGVLVAVLRPGAPGVAAPPACDTSRGELTIGVIAPLTGERAAAGTGIRNSVDLAVREANARCAVPGYRLAVDAVDEEGAADSAAYRLAGTPTVVGVVGAVGSGVTGEAQRILGDRDVVLISPSASRPDLSRGTDPTAPVRLYPTFFRTTATDIDVGRAVAEALDGLSLRNVLVVDDGTAYSAALRAGFEESAARHGFTVAHERLVPTDQAPLVGALRTLAPQAVVVAGEEASARAMGDVARAAGLTAPLVGGEGMLAAGAGRPSADGDMALVATAPIAQLRGPGRAFADAYAAGGYGTRSADGSPFAYDAAGAIVAATAAVVGNRGWDPALRVDLRDAVQRSRLAGATGTVAFDRFGDPLNPLVTVYERQVGGFVPVRLLVAAP